MNITELGTYILTKDFIFMPGKGSIATLREGTEIHVTQIDMDYHKIYVPEFGDWHFYNLPVVKKSA